VARYILGVDPGPKETAWVLWDSQEHCKVHFGYENNDTALAGFRAFKQGGAVDVMAMEMIASYGMAVGASVFETCVWIGRFLEAWQGPHELVYRKDVKMHLCGSMRAKDTNVRQALLDKIGPVGSKTKVGPLYGVSGDVWSALAVAVTYAETRNGQ
jgi:hypothetical protein